MNENLEAEIEATADFREAVGLIHPRYDLPVWSEILPDLWMGGTDYADRLGLRFKSPFVTTENFDTVVTMYGYANPCDWYVTEYRYPILDSEDVDFDLDVIRNLVRTAYRDWKLGKRVLIRCQAGLNRSGLITALVLMMDGFTAEEAIDLIRNTRDPECLYNTAFTEWLSAQVAEDWLPDSE